MSTKPTLAPEIEPCPHSHDGYINGEISFLLVDEADFGVEEFNVKCYVCFALGPRCSTVIEAIEAWNIVSRLRADNEALRATRDTERRQHENFQILSKQISDDSLESAGIIAGQRDQLSEEVKALRAKQSDSTFEPCGPGVAYELRRVERATFTNPTLIINHAGAVAAFWRMEEAAYFVGLRAKLAEVGREIDLANSGATLATIEQGDKEPSEIFYQMRSHIRAIQKLLNTPQQQKIESDMKRLKAKLGPTNTTGVNNE